MKAGCPRCEHETPLWARPETWAALGAIGLFLVSGAIILYYSYVGGGLLGFAIAGMVFAFFPARMLAEDLAGAVAYARMRAGLEARRGRPSWTQQLQQARPRPVHDEDDDDE